MLESAYLNSLIARAKQDVKTIVLPEGEDERILKAAHLITAEKAAKVIILGDVESVKNILPDITGAWKTLNLSTQPNRQILKNIPSFSMSCARKRA